MARKKKRKASGEESERDKARQQRHESLVGAMDRIGQKQDEDQLFCNYVAEKLRQMTVQERDEAHGKIFEVVRDILGRRN